MHSLVRQHFINISHFLLFNPFVIFCQLKFQKLVGILIFEEGVGGEIDVKEKRVLFGLGYYSLVVLSAVSDFLLLSLWLMHIILLIINVTQMKEGIFIQQLSMIKLLTGERHEHDLLSSRGLSYRLQYLEVSYLHGCLRI